MMRLTKDDAQALAALNARRVKRADTAANVLFAVVLGVIGAIALLHCLAPCAVEGALC
jgi:hypothetical protein